MGTLSERVIQNTVYNSAGRIWGILVALFLSPYIIQRVGVERFGVWAVVVSVTGYFGLLDFGVGTAFVKYIAEYHARKEYGRINEVVSTGVIFYSLVMCAVLGLLYFFIGPIFVFLNISPGMHDEAVFAFWAGAGIFCVSNVLSPFAAVQNGLQRMDIFNKVSIVMSVFSTTATIYALSAGYGLRGLVAANVCAFCLTSVINLRIAYRLLPQLAFRLSLCTRGAFSRLFTYGYKLQISRFANLVSFQTDNLLLSHFLGIGLVTYYQLGAAVVQQVRQVALLLISALVPAVSEIEATRTSDYMNELFVRGSRYLIAASVPLTVFLVIDASLIIAAWMGAGYMLSTLVIRFLAVGYCAATVTGIASSIAAGVARTDLDMKFGIVMATMNLVLSIVLIQVLGFTGALIGTALSLTISSVYFMCMFHKYLAIGTLAGFGRLFLKPLGACVVPTGVVVLANLIVRESLLSGGRMLNASYLIASSLIFFAAYMFFIIRMKYFDAYDIGLLLDKVPQVKRFFLHDH